MTETNCYPLFVFNTILIWLLNLIVIYLKRQLNQSSTYTELNKIKRVGKGVIKENNAWRQSTWTLCGTPVCLSVSPSHVYHYMLKRFLVSKFYLEYICFVEVVLLSNCPSVRLIRIFFSDLWDIEHFCHSQKNFIYKKGDLIFMKIAELSNKQCL